MRYTMGLLVLLGCAPDRTPPPERHSPHEISGRSFNRVNRFVDTLPEGRIVYCYTYEGYKAGGISCVIP